MNEKREDYVLLQLLKKHCKRGVAVIDPNRGIDSISVSAYMPVEEQEAFSEAFWQAEPFKSMRQFFTLEVSNLPWYKCRFKRSKYQVFISNQRKY
ncbi:hypothetical protein [Photobacterium leiognathi]|uniref:hypothetical protein n=1 Tax=Photobacterium leiognathi TaxID=553611 RepID=UPI0029827ABA|nr:hypothetical protein [Photobacterium leiognathi]